MKKSYPKNINLKERKKNEKKKRKKRRFCPSLGLPYSSWKIKKCTAVPIDTGAKLTQYLELLRETDLVQVVRHDTEAAVLQGRQISSDTLASPQLGQLGG